MTGITGVIITYNEEKHIRACIESILPVVDELIIVDSFSSDNTESISNEYDLKFVKNIFEGHIEQKNFAVSLSKYEYVLSLDADEQLSPEMTRSILQVKENFKYNAYSFNRLNNYCGQWLKYSWYPDRKLRLWNKNLGKWGGTNPHDKVIMQTNLTVKKLKGDILHYAYHGVNEHLLQIQKFALIAAKAKYAKGGSANFFIHLLFSPFFKFFRKYILNFGFLDGYYGFIYCYMAAYLNFAKYTQLWEMRRKK